MKKRIIMTLALCSLLATNKVQAKPINTAFTDDNFYKCVIENYNSENGQAKGTDYNITNQDLETIEHLVCPNENIEDITGIDKMPLLQTIDLSNNKITSIAPLLKQENSIIEKLNLSNNNIKWLYITNLTALNELDISNNNMEHITLSNYINTLKLDGNNFMKNIYINLKNGSSVNIGDYVLFDNIDATDKRITVEYTIKDNTIAEKSGVGTITAKKDGITQATLIIKNGEEVIYGPTENNEETNSTITVSNSCMPLATGARRYTVSFETNGGKELENIGTAIMFGIDPKEEKLELPTPTKEGYKFIGWYTDKDLKNKANIKSYGDIVDLENINEDECSTELIVRLYAKWDKIVENPKTGVKSYTVLGLLTIIALSGTYVVYQKKINRI